MTSDHEEHADTIVSYFLSLTSQNVNAVLAMEKALKMYDDIKFRNCLV